MHAHSGPGAITMSKIQRGNKESKKQPNLTAKEKKAAKRQKKRAESEHTPFIVKDA